MGSVSRQSRKALLGKKLGMTQIFSEDGKWIPVTVLQAGPCAVLQIKTEEQDGYSSYQIGFDDRRKNAKRPQQVCFDNLGVNTKRFVREIPFIDPADILTGGVPVAPEPEEESAEAEEAAVEEVEAEEAAPEAEDGEDASADEDGGKMEMPGRTIRGRTMLNRARKKLPKRKLRTSLSRPQRSIPATSLAPGSSRV